MRVHLSIAIAGVVRCHQRHVAIRAGLRLVRIVERARALARDAAGLPVVVIVEAAHPAVVVYRHVQMHFMARGAEFRRLLAHERLEKRRAVRLRVEIGEKAVHRLNHGI